jgi:glycosyltransferase involved in cell wall biosynthesis
VAPRRRGLPRGVRAIRIALDTTALRQTRAGTARYVAGLRDHLDADVVEVAFPATSRLRSAAADALWYPLLRAPRGARLLHCPTFRGPFRSSVPLVVTVHDLAVLRHPEWFNRWTARYSGFAVPRVVAAADRVIAVSEHTRRELEDLLGLDAGKIEVVPNAVEDAFGPAGPRAEGDYVLAVGTLEPRKNLARIAAAVEGELRVVGSRGWGGVEPPANVRWLGDVSDAELAELYRGARCLVYASLYEGFGIPVAEALACGCPIVTSRDSPMEEVAGADATYVDPLDTESIREGIERAFAPAPRRIASWNEVAARTRTVYQELLGEELA